MSGHLPDPLLRRRSVGEPELMDEPDCDPVALVRTYRLFALINPFVAGWRRVYARHLRPVLREAVREHGHATVLDVGSGGGDVARALARRAARDRLPVSVVAIDPDPRAHAYASDHSRRTASAGTRRRPVRARFGPGARGDHRHGPGVSYRCVSSAELVAQGESFDVVVSNHVLHHLDDAAVRALLTDSQALCTGIAVHNDLRRSRLAWLAWWVATLPLARMRAFVRFDGLLSIRRARTAPELDALVPAAWTARRHRPFRMLLLRCF